MKIIITGATGALGRALTQYFSSKGDEVMAVGRMKTPPANLLKHATYHFADITAPFTLPDADVCIHAAALSDDKGSEEAFSVANITGTLNVLNATKNCRQFVFISSSSVYMPSALPLKEEDAVDVPELSAYGRSKLRSENALKENYRGESCVILRPRALYGPGDIKILPRMLKLVKKEKIYRPGAMNINVSMTHYRNLCAAIDKCIEQPLKGIRTYNAADEKTYVLAESLRTLMKSIYGKPLEEKQTPIWILKALSKFNLGGITPLLVRSLTNDMVLDISRIKNELGYRSVTNLDESLAELTSWVKKIGGPEILKTAEKNIAWE
jgi:nucleoside-diphosphate-sugar epimerase